MARALIAALLVATTMTACRRKPAPVVDAGPAADAAPPALSAAASTAPAPAAPALEFVVEARYPAGVIASLYPLADGMAVLEESFEKKIWKLSTIAVGKTPLVLSKGTSYDHLTAVVSVSGTRETVFLRHENHTVTRISPKGTKRYAGTYSEVVELRAGQWVGLVWNDPNGPKYDAPPALKSLEGPPDSLPVIPTHMSPWKAVHLADGKICADGSTADDHLPGIWTADVEGHQYIAPVGGQAEMLFRGGDGECWALTETKVLLPREPSGDGTKAAGSAKKGTMSTARAVVRVKGDSADPPVVVDFEAMGLDTRVPEVDREGGLWFIGKNDTPVRVTVKDVLATSTLYPVPKTIPGVDDCQWPRARGIGAQDANAIWVVMYCGSESGQFDDVERPAYLLRGTPKPVH